jgi:DNA-binding response OmpR family regulator
MSSKWPKLAGDSAVRILFADNDPKFMQSPARLLKAQGWDVTTVTSLSEARSKMETDWFHIAILDLRLVNDDDDHDISGVLLAKEKRFEPIPKVIYTTYVNGAQREAQALAEPLPLVSKQDPRAKLIEAVRTELNRTRTNWNLEVRFGPATRLNFEDLADTILATESDNAEIEANDLLKRLFHAEKRAVTLKRILWVQDNRAALEIATHAPVAGQEFFIVVCGPREKIEAEIELYKKMGPKAQGGTSTYLSESVVTTHFGAIAYAIYTPESDKIQNLRASYGTPKEFQAAMTGLFQTTLPPWHREDASRGTETAGELYRRSLVGDASATDLKRNVAALVRQGGRAKFDVLYENGRLHVSGGPSDGYSDPLSRISKWSDSKTPAWIANFPGSLTGENVLVDPNGRAWCTNFADAGEAHVLASHVSLEAQIRWDFAECAVLSELNDMEQRLNDPAQFWQLDDTAVDPGCRKALHAIKEVRRLAAQMPSHDIDAYQAGLYYEAVRRLAGFDPSADLEKRSLIRLLHALVAAAMIVSPKTGRSGDVGIDIDRASRIVRINGRPVHLEKLQFDILSCLDDKKPNLCLRQEIFEKAYSNEPYRADKSQNLKLNKAIAGLREVIGERLQNVRGLGYRLN